MVQKSHSQPPGMVQKPYVNNWKKLPYQLVIAGFLPSSTVCKSMMLYTHYTHKNHPEVEKVDLLDEFTHPKTGRKREWFLGIWGRLFKQTSVKKLGSWKMDRFLYKKRCFFVVFASFQVFEAVMFWANTRLMSASQPYTEVSNNNYFIILLSFWLSWFLSFSSS